MKKSIIVVSGSRGIVSKDTIEAFLNKHLANRTQIHVRAGCAGGVDQATRLYCAKMGISFETWFAQWDRQGKAAGPIRNSQMVAGADILVAIWDGQSPGTRNCINEALKQGVDVIVKIMQMPGANNIPTLWQTKG